jgi:hypothetical protein
MTQKIAINLKFDWKKVKFAAIAIGQVDRPPFNTHSGIIYEGEDGKKYMLHLSFHFELKRAEYHKRFGWVSPNIHASRERSIAGLCRLIWKKHKTTQALPFSLRLDKAIRFNTISGDLCLSTGGCGLNCSNFVIIVYLSSGVDLIDYATWMPREEDKAWHTWLVTCLETKKAARAHIDAVRSEIGCCRVRPEEVAGAGLEAVIPASFSACEAGGKRIKSELVERYKSQGTKA